METIIAIVFMGSILVVNSFHLKATKEIQVEVAQKLDTLEVLVDAYNGGIAEVREIKKQLMQNMH